MINQPGFENWNRAMRGSYRKGYESGLMGFPTSSCPYKDVRKWDGRLTWSRAFNCAWHDGWKAGDSERKSALITAYYDEKKTRGQPPGMPR